MNEQLVVKNFGPIKDATVDFKRVTVFIGPTGGGKSTLAKLAAIFRDAEFMHPDTRDITIRNSFFSTYNIKSFISNKTRVEWKIDIGNIIYENDEYKDEFINSLYEPIKKHLDASLAYLNLISYEEINDGNPKLLFEKAINSLKTFENEHKRAISPSSAIYIPSERLFLAALEYSWAGLMRDNIGLPKVLLIFANNFSLSRKNVIELDILFLNARYIHIDGRDFIQIPERAEPIILSETASGIQSVTPMLVLLEHLSRNTEQAQSFIIEEPELNLYPTAQQGLLNWLVEKCTKGENDLTITTHSPYLLAHFNTLLFAYQVAQNHPERADEIAKIVPRESWINPAEFAAYHVEGQQENGVRSIVNPETGLISYNGLDAIASAEATDFEKLLDINAGLEVA